MNIIINFDSTAGSAPAGYATAVQAACNFFDNTFSNNVAVHITFGWSALSGNSVAQNSSYEIQSSYSTVRSALAAHDAATAGLSSVYLPTTDPFAIGSGLLSMSTAEARALGLTSYSGTDGEVTLNSQDAFNFNPSVPAVAGEYNAVGTLEHEISEILGRECGTDGSLNPTPEGLLRYSAVGQIDTSGSYANAYLSLNGGASGLGPVGEQGSDLADWGSGVSGDAFGYAVAGIAEPASAADLALMTALGWSLTTSAVVVSAPVHANDLSYAGTASGYNHFIDLLNFEASFPDLIHAFGTNQSQMQAWYNANEPSERRVANFDGLDYVASYADLITAYRSAGSMHAVEDAGATDYINNGFAQGRSISFNGLDYIASYNDLIAAFGANSDAGAYHYIENGSTEGRATTFDGLDYIASYGDLIHAFGANEQAGAAHFIDFGVHEGRTTTFDGLSYIAQYTDLMNAFGANNDAGASHYITNGINEGRSNSFDVAGYEAAHPDLQGQYATNDQFLTAYINTYVTTGHFLT